MNERKKTWKLRVPWSVTETSQSHCTRVPCQGFNLCFSLILFFSERGAKTSLKWLLCVKKIVVASPLNAIASSDQRRKHELTLCTEYIIMFLDNVVGVGVQIGPQEGYEFPANRVVEGRNQSIH